MNFHFVRCDLSIFQDFFASSNFVKIAWYKNSVALSILKHFNNKVFKYYRWYLWKHLYDLRTYYLRHWNSKMIMELNISLCLNDMEFKTLLIWSFYYNFSKGQSLIIGCLFMLWLQSVRLYCLIKVWLLKWVIDKTDRYMSGWLSEWWIESMVHD